MMMIQSKKCQNHLSYHKYRRSKFYAFKPSYDSVVPPDGPRPPPWPAPPSGGRDSLLRAAAQWKDNPNGRRLQGAFTVDK